jgi:phage RecT family recombinase
MTNNIDAVVTDVETNVIETNVTEVKKQSRGEAIRDLLNNKRDHFLPLLHGSQEERNDNYNKLVTNFCFALIEKNLEHCTGKSIIVAFKQCCDTNLNPSNGLGKIYLIKYRDDVVAQIGYAGYLELVMRSEKISHVYSKVVFEGDEFEVSFNNKTNFTHNPKYKSRNLIRSYAVAVFKNGDIQIEVADIEDIEMSRSLSKSSSSSSSPWKMHYNSMAEVVAMRRLMKPLGLSLNITNEFLNTIDVVDKNKED